MQVLAQLYDGAVEVLMASIESTRPLRNHEFIVAERLHLEIIVIIGNAEQLFVGLTGHDCPVKLTCFTGRESSRPSRYWFSRLRGTRGF